MVDELRAWLRSCPLIDSKDRFDVNYLGAEPVCYTVDEVPTTPIIKKYLDGSTLRQKVFVVASRDAYGANVLQNIANSGFWEQFTEWVETQNAHRQYPSMRDGQTPRKIEVTTSHYLFESGADTARYQIQMALTYYQKGERT